MSCLRLPAEYRRDFAHPRGLVVSGNLIPYLDGFSRLICVGDVVSSYCAGVNSNLILLVIDGKTRRYSRIEASLPPGFSVFRVWNPPATLSLEAEELICKLASREGKYAVLVDGEEDIVALAAVECAPNGTAIVYGVPGEGATIIVSGPLTRGDAGGRKLELAPSNECFKPASISLDR